MKVGEADVTIGAAIPAAVALYQGKKLNMQQLLEVQHHSETYNQSGQTRDMFYVESWLFVHYLFDTEQVTRAGQYFTLTNNNRVPIPQAVQTAFGMSIDQLNDALLAYFKGDKIRIIRYNYKKQIVDRHADNHPPHRFHRSPHSARRPSPPRGGLHCTSRKGTRGHRHREP